MGGTKEMAAAYHARAVDMFKRAADLQSKAEAHQAQADAIGAILPGYGALSAHAALHADDRSSALSDLPLPKVPVVEAPAE